MEELPLPSVGASFKKWGCYRCTPPKEAHALACSKGLKFFYKKDRNFFILKRSPDMAGRGGAGLQSAATNCWSPTPPHRSSIFPTPCPLASSPLPPNFLVFSQLFLIGSSTLPALPKLLLKTSNTHNF
jgi:hypothetical protein